MDRKPDFFGSFTAIDAYIEQQMRRLSIPGAALAVVEGDQVTHLRGFGKAQPGGRAPGPQTLFMIGSLTKSITSLAVMQLVEAGQVELDAPVQCYLPWFRVADRKASAQITVRHLLNQTSGLPMSAGMETLANFDRHPDAMERQARALSTQTLAHPVGSTCQYCNPNYDLLGLVIEAASGERYADYIQKHIFAPLGMLHTFTDKDDTRQNEWAVGHRYWFGLPIPATDLPIPRASLASGQIISCVEDMARYLSAHLNGGCTGEARVLSEAGMRALHQGAAEYIEFGISAGKYAMGWFDMQIGPNQVINHGGNVPEYSAYLGFLPEQKKGLVLLINADHYGLPPVLSEVGWGATTLLAGSQPAPTSLAVVPWIMRLLALVPLLQIIGAARTLHQVRRWRQDPSLRPGSTSFWVQHVLLPLIPNLALAALPVFFRAKRMGGFLRLFMPDVYWVSLFGGAFSGLWAILRTLLLAQVLRKH